MTHPPTGTLTFLFTDIEGSTARWETQREAMAAALVRHDTLLRESIEAVSYTHLDVYKRQLLARRDRPGEL